MTVQDRRSFIAAFGGGALALACGRWPGSAGLPLAHRHLDRIGIQLYTFRHQAAADLPGALARLAKIGFKEIEFWGSFKQTPAEIRTLLDQNGLASPSVHIGLPSNPGALHKAFADATVMGQESIIVASLPSALATLDDWKKLAAQFNDAGSRASAAGFTFGFHNHTEGFKKIGGAAPFDVLVAETDPALVFFELDVHWAYAGGADPIELLTRYPTRFRMLHVKDSSGPPDYTQTDVGAGTYPWAKILDVAGRNGIKHYFVEHDSPADPMGFAKTSYEYLTHLEF